MEGQRDTGARAGRVLRPRADPRRPPAGPRPGLAARPVRASGAPVCRRGYHGAGCRRWRTGARGPGSVQGAERKWMKIRSVTPWIVEVPATEPGVMYSQGQPGTQRGGRQYVFVQVETDEGLTGWGEITTYPGPIANRAVCAVLRELGPLLDGAGRRPTSRPSGSASSGPSPTSGTRGVTTVRRQRDRHRAVGHPGQGARAAHLRAARRPGARDDPALHPLPLRPHAARRPPSNALVPVRDGHRAIKTDPFCRRRWRRHGHQRTWTADQRGRGAEGRGHHRGRSARRWGRRWSS